MATRNSVFDQSDPQVLREMYCFLRNEVLELNSRWIVFKQLFAQGDERVRLLNREVPSFFKMFHDSMRDGIFMSITRLTDKPKVSRKQTLSLRQLVGHRGLVCNGTVVSRWNALLGEIERERETIKVWRDTSGAHNDLDTVIDPARLLPPIMFDSVGIVVGLVEDLLNIVGPLLGEPPTDFENIIIFGDGDTIVSCIEQAKEHRLCRGKDQTTGA